MGQREMRLHEWYKCDFCKEFHPLTLNWTIKTTVHTDILGEHPMLHESVPELLKPVLQSRTLSQYTDNCQLVDEKLNKLQKMLTSTRASEDRQMVFYAKHQLDGCFHVAKCLAEQKNICVTEIKKRFILDPKFPERDMNGIIQYMASYMHVQIYQPVRVFTSDPADHWLEITGFKLHIAPLWFNGSRVYQFHVKVNGYHDSIQDTTHYELSMKIGSTNQPVLSWDSEHTPRPTEFDKMKNLIMSFQLMMTSQVSGIPLLSELRLCYYGNSKTPRVWIRSPLAQRVAGSNPLDFVPIYSDESSAFPMNSVFAIKKKKKKKKKKKARMMLAVDQKIDENLNIIERLERL